MICCVNCFKDEEIRSIIKSLEMIGNCEVCHSTNVSIYDTEENNELKTLFNELLEIYYPLSSLTGNYPRGKSQLLKDELCRNWNIFHLDEEKVYELIRSICADKYKEIPALFDDPIGIPAITNEEYLKNMQLFGLNDWQHFATSIKQESRFHTNILKTNILAKYLKYSVVYLKAGSIFYRARLLTKEKSLSKEEMGAPPNKKAVDGRANPKGISYLYLGQDVETAINEIGASAQDRVFVGTFKLKEAIEIINLLSLSELSPFRLDDITQYAINRNHFRQLGKEIARPVTSKDDVLEYLPTQYIVDFIKSRKYDGIQYPSTKNEGGRNIAIFNEKDLECIDVQEYKINSLNFKIKQG